MKLPAPTALVLVAILPHPRDLEIARTLGWYRIPFRTAPRLVAVDYLAFYQPASFGRRRWRIDFVARVVGHEFVRRAELLTAELDHPRAQEEYYKLQIDAITALPRPVLANKWKRVSFLYTTGDRLLAAEVLDELVVSAEERPLLWRALRERVLRAGRYASGAPPALDPPREVLEELFGLLR